jgi:hypothetical protein
MGDFGYVSGMVFVFGRIDGAVIGFWIFGC